MDEIERLEALLGSPGCGRFLLESFYANRPPMTCGDGVNMCGDCLKTKRLARHALDTLWPHLVAVAKAVEHPTIRLLEDLCHGLGCGSCLGCLNRALNTAIREQL